MGHRFGIPIVTAERIFLDLEQLGISRWKKTEPPLPLAEFLKRTLTDFDRQNLRFAPKVEVASFRNPLDQSIFRGFRTLGSHGSVVFSLLPGDLIPICSEFRHGCETISLNLPGGTIGQETPEVCAKREFEEETGISLGELIPLTTHGVPLDARSSIRRNFSFIGVPQEPIQAQSPQLDSSEVLRVVLISLEDWLKLIERDQVSDGFSIITTFLALRKLGRA